MIEQAAIESPALCTARGIKRWIRAVGSFVSGIAARAWPGVAIGVVVGLVVGQAYVGSLGSTGLGVWVDASAIALISILAGAILGLLGLLGRWVILKAPKVLIYVLAGTVGVFAVIPFKIWPSVVILFAIAGALLSIAAARGLRKPVSLVLAVVAIAIIAGPVTFIAWPGSAAHLISQHIDITNIPQLPSPDPSKPGSFQTEYLTYGSGTDIRRPEYGAEVGMRTPTIDATPFLSNPRAKWRRIARETFWGFDASALPLNARIWHPRGSGPFPLVLMIHGNHTMEEFSDPGYAYLGEHLASHGYIFVSVDQNFLNGNWAGNWGHGEATTRAWMLLQHLKLWREWNGAAGNLFNGRVDLDRIAIAGHSRGGQAALTANALNRLPCFPDDGKHAFDFGFGIKAVISIAPNDWHEISGAQVPVENVHFLTLYGGHDSDVTGFWGLRPYYRAAFTDDQYWCKSAVYLYRSNHSQFNTAWGHTDLPPLRGWFVNRKAVIAGDEQRRAAKAFITAFLHSTLRGEGEYLDFLRDHRRGRVWLPDDIYVTQFEDSRLRIVADFSEDLDLHTATVPGGSIAFEHLTHVSERTQSTRDAYGGNTGHKVSYIGWDRSAEGTPTPHYSITLPSALAADWKLSPQSRLIFSLCNARQAPAELDVTMVLEDASGARVKLPLSRFGPIHPPLISRVSKASRFENLGVARDWEQVPQTFELPLADFNGINPAQLSAIRFIFDRTEAGEIVLSRVGLDPGDAR